RVARSSALRSPRPPPPRPPPPFPTRRSSDLGHGPSQPPSTHASFPRDAAEAEARGMPGAEKEEGWSSIQLFQESQLGWGCRTGGDRKSTRLNSSHVKNSYAAFCSKKKTKHQR